MGSGIARPMPAGGSPRCDGANPVTTGQVSAIVRAMGNTPFLDTANRAGASGAAPAGPVVVPLPVPLRLVVHIVKSGIPNRPGLPIDGNDLWITVHETDNNDPTADARMHRDYVDGGAEGRKVSFHFAVDDREAYQILPISEIGWHAGDNCDSPATDTGCFRSVGIETCVNAPSGSPRWAQAKRNLSALVAALVVVPHRFEGGAGKRFAFARIAQHHRWSNVGKDCPKRMRAERSLPAVIAEAQAMAAAATP